MLSFLPPKLKFWSKRLLKKKQHFLAQIFKDNKLIKKVRFSRYMCLDGFCIFLVSFDKKYFVKPCWKMTQNYLWRFLKNSVFSQDYGNSLWKNVVGIRDSSLLDLYSVQNDCSEERVNNEHPTCDLTSNIWPLKSRFWRPYTLIKVFPSGCQNNLFENNTTE